MDPKLVQVLKVMELLEVCIVVLDLVEVLGQQNRLLMKTLKLLGSMGLLETLDLKGTPHQLFLMESMNLVAVLVLKNKNLKDLMDLVEI